MKYNIVGIADSSIENEIQQRYGNNEEHVGYARQIAEIAGEFTNQTPITGLKGKERVKERREYRRKCREYLTTKTREKIQPVGFGGFVLMAILSGIISFFVQRLMREYFDDEGECNS